MSGGLNLLLLDPVLDSLSINQLLQLLLLSDQKMILMSISLGWHCVQTRQIFVYLSLYLLMIDNIQS